MRRMVAFTLAGATVVPVAELERHTVGRLIEQQAVTALIGVPFMFATLAESRWSLEAIMRPAGACGPGDIVDVCGGWIADCEISSLVEFRATLPRSATGKILRTVP